MLVTITEVLTKEDISVVHDLIATASFQDGRLSAGREAVTVKNNLEMSISDAQMQRLNNLVMGKLVQKRRNPRSTGDLLVHKAGIGFQFQAEGQRTPPRMGTPHLIDGFPDQAGKLSQGTRGGSPQTGH